MLKPAENVRLQTFEVTSDKKQELLEHLLKSEEGSFLVFVRTKHGAERVAQRLTRSGDGATSIHGDRTQAQRSAALKSFSKGGHRILVATDVAARGLDVDHVAHVVNYDMPKMAELLCIAWPYRTRGSQGGSSHLCPAGRARRPEKD